VSGPPARRAFLDACALFPPLSRGLLLSAAAEGLYEPAWSAGVIDEWAWANRRDHGPDGEAAVRAEAAAMAARWPRAEAAAEPDAALSLPDAGDVHVLSAALAAGADLLVTYNLRDFPARKLRGLGLAPIHPDAFLWELAGAAPEAMGRALSRALAAFPKAAADRAEAVRALKRARLYRLAKLVRGGALTPAGG
jgi:hypothetical protein